MDQEEEEERGGGDREKRRLQGTLRTESKPSLSKCVVSKAGTLKSSRKEACPATEAVPKATAMEGKPHGARAPSSRLAMCEFLVRFQSQFPPQEHIAEGTIM